MATNLVFGNKTISEPGAYSRILSGVKNPTVDLSSGNVLIVDTGNGALFGGGSGISGELAQGKDSIYSFDNIADFQSFVRGGVYYHLAPLLFQPDGPTLPGAPLVTIVRGATTTAGTITFTFASGGQIVIKPKAEGYGANGILGDEVRAVGTIDITAAVDDGVISAQVDAVSIGDYTVQAGDTPADAAEGVAAAIVASQGPQGYAATSNGSLITILGIPNDGAAANSKVLTASITGSSTADVATFSGGVDGSKLTQGFGSQLESGIIDTAKFRFSFYRGAFTGDAADDLPYGEIEPSETQPVLVSRSSEISSVDEFVAWAESDFEFNQSFVISSTITGVIAGG